MLAAMLSGLSSHGLALMRHDGLEDPPGSKPERKYCMCKGEPVLCPALAYFLFYFIGRLRLLLLLEQPDV